MMQEPRQEEPEVVDPATIRARERSYVVRRVQRAVEYLLLIALHLFFLLAFAGNYNVLVALLLGGSTLTLNVRLTLMRENRRLLPSRHRERLRADAFEAVLFLILVVVLSAGSVLLSSLMHIDQREYTTYVASTLAGLFLGGLLGELLWHRRVYRTLPLDRRARLLEHLPRSVILPYAVTRRWRRGV